jgi:hypothetical protein
MQSEAIAGYQDRADRSAEQSNTRINGYSLYPWGKEGSDLGLKRYNTD